MLPQPDWKLTPEFEILNHRRLAKEYLPGFIPTVNLCWENVNANADDIDYTDPNFEEAKPIKTREDFVQEVRTALEDRCLEPMTIPEEDVDLICAVHVLSWCHGGCSVLLPAPTHQTNAAVVAAGYSTLSELLQVLSYEIKQMTLQPEMITA